jgi:asparagine synthase (glutamine-hydrolysing)
MKIAKGKVKVLLDGQGGDEVFGGYYGNWTFILSIMKDKDIKNFLSNLRLFCSFLNKDDIHRLSSYLFPQLYNKVVRGYFSNNFKILKTDLLPKISREELYYDADPPKIFRHYLNNFSFHYIRTLTIPSLLHYEDRASMAHSIESRVPFLDYRLVQLGINLHPHHLIYRNVFRPLYRKALENHLPVDIIERKNKLGFPTPFAKWTRNTLKPLVTDILLSNKSKIYNYLDINFVMKNLEDHFSAKSDYSWFIWRLLSLEKFLHLKQNLINKSYLV